MTNHSDISHGTSGRSSRWISCIAKADFVGDARCTQLSFRKNDRLEIDLRLPPQNGWRWGRTNISKGWFPEWAAEPLSSRTTTSLSEHQHEPSSFFQQSKNNNNHHGLGRSRDRVAPLAHISENPINDMRMIQRPQQDKNYEYNGFDSQSNEIMGGQNLPIVSIAKGGGGNHSEDQRTTRLERKKDNHGGLNWKDTFTVMTRNENPYTKYQKEPEWDGSEVPQIVNNVNGKVTVLGTDGKASSYQNERSYKLAEATNRMVEKLSTTSKSLEKRAFSGLQMPALQKPKSSNNSSGSGKDADTKNNTTTKNHREIPKIFSFSKKMTMGSKKSRVQEEREETIVDDRHRSSRSSRLTIRF